MKENLQKGKGIWINGPKKYKTLIYHCQKRQIKYTKNKVRRRKKYNEESQQKYNYNNWLRNNNCID